MRSGVPKFTCFVSCVFVALPLPFTAVDFLLPWERAVVVSNLGGAEMRELDAVGVLMQRVTKESARRGPIQQAEIPIDALGADQTLWLLPPRGGWAGLSTGDDLEALDARLGEGFRFERRPNRWADQMFVALLAMAGMVGLLWPVRQAIPPAR